MKPFAQRSFITPPKHIQLYPIMITDCCTERIRTIEGRLAKRNDMDVTNVSNKVAACCILHNICEMFNDSIPESWLSSITEEDQPPTAVIWHDTTYETDATIIHDTLVNHYST